MQVGNRVDDFQATDQTGQIARLSDLLETGPVVLFLYPKAMTAGCTAEACHFRNLRAEFEALGAQPVGISRDDARTQQRFDQEHQLGFPLLSDPDAAIARHFGAKRIGPLWSKRETFVIDRDRTVLGAIRSESDMEAHADEALQILARASDRA